MSLPLRRSAALTLALAVGLTLGACRKPSAPSEPQPDPVAVVDAGEDIDAPAACTAACNRLQACVPELAGDLDGDPSSAAERLADSCAPACQGFSDVTAALAIRDCAQLDACTAFWGCVGTAEARPWLATVAPVGERTCENLCSQASACAIAKVCETEAEPGAEGEPDRRRPGRLGRDDKPSEDAPEIVLDEDCLRDEALRAELDERCLQQCRALPDDSRARAELIGCIDHVSCDGLLECLDGWAATDYQDASGPAPGIRPTCDGFCTRAIVCGAADSELELEPDELDELKQTMTSTYVECAVQCEKDLEVGGDAAQAAFEQCTAVATCDEFAACADAV